MWLAKFEQNNVLGMRRK